MVDITTLALLAKLAADALSIGLGIASVCIGLLGLWLTAIKIDPQLAFELVVAVLSVGFGIISVCAGLVCLWLAI